MAAAPALALRAPRSRLLLPAVLGAATLCLYALSSLLTVAFTDYEEEALPAVTALLHGDIGRFLDLLPAYGGSLILRAPAALAAGGAGGGELAVYRALALPCLAAAVMFGVYLWSCLVPVGARAGIGAWVALAVVVANPLILPALDTGHPEELLGAVLCAAGVAAAWRDRPLAAGVLIGLAGANKAWAILAVLPALAALRHGRATFVVACAAVAVAVLGPVLLHGSHAVGAAQAVAQQSGQIFQPWQWTWFLGHHGQVVSGLYGVKPGYRTGPGWLGAVGHLPILLLPLAVGALGALRRVRREDALLLLALCFLVRCVVDPWDTAYYHLPFLMALAAHEVLARRRAPVVTVALTAAIYASTIMARDALGPDGQALLYLAWSVPTLGAVATALLAPRAWGAATGRAGGTLAALVPSLVRAFGAQPTTVSSLGSPVSTSCPSAVTTTRSSIRTPTAPGT